MLCDDLEGWMEGGGVGGGLKREGIGGIYVCICLIHFVVQQKLTKHCEAIILK